MLNALHTSISSPAQKAIPITESARPGLGSCSSVILEEVMAKIVAPLPIQ
jgi:hypothetical protein